MIKIKDLSKKFEKTLSLDSVNLNFVKGDAVALMVQMVQVKQHLYVLYWGIIIQIVVRYLFWG